MVEKYYRKDELAGKLVYNSRALKIGKVTDVGYSKVGGIGLIVKLGKDKEEIIPFTAINEIGDIVFLKPDVEGEKERLKPEFEEAPQRPEEKLDIKKCPNCGNENKHEDKFCRKCGEKINEH